MFDVLQIHQRSICFLLFVLTWDKRWLALWHAKAVSPAENEVNISVDSCKYCLLLPVVLGEGNVPVNAVPSRNTTR